MHPTSRRSILTALFATILCTAPGKAAESATPRFHAGVAFGGGVGAARVEGVRLEFGRTRFAPAIALRGGMVLSPEFLLGLQLDAVGAGSGKVVVLSPTLGPTVPATTTHRVAVNHLSLVGTWRPGAGVAFIRAGAGLA